MVNKELKNRLSKVKNFPTLPVVVKNVLRLTQNPESTSHEIGEAISQDQALAATVLRTANSAFYGFPRKISTIQYAIVVLGLNNVKNIILSTSILNNFSHKFSFDRKDFWKHSLICGIISKKLAEHIGIKNSEEVFMWGLLHDIGKIILDIYFHEEFLEALLLSKRKQLSLKEAEEKVFGFNHAGVGALLLQKWSLPPSLVKAVECHHNPEQDYSVFKIASIVHVADFICRKIGIGSGGDEITPELNKHAWQSLKLTSSLVENMSTDIVKEFKQATEFLYSKGKDNEF